VPLAALAVAAPAVASVDPSISVRPQHAAPGETRITVQGLSWVVGAGCDPVVRVALRRGDVHVSLGASRVVPSTAAFRLQATVPAALGAGTWRIVATQRCRGDDYRRTARIRVA
jgi:hypothetical protein